MKRPLHCVYKAGSHGSGVIALRVDVFAVRWYRCRSECKLTYIRTYIAYDIHRILMYIRKHIVS